MSEGSATRNADATASVSKGGEFSSRVARDPPQTTSGHQPGHIASEADRAPEFHAETLPAGTAPASRTFAPNATPDVDPSAESASASDTLGGATSGDMHAGLGHPGQGMSSNEAHHDGGKTHRGGLQGVGASGVQSDGQSGADRVDMSTDVAGATQKREGGRAGEIQIGEDRNMQKDSS